MSEGGFGPLPRLHVVTDSIVLAGEAFAETARALLEAGGPRLALHLRGPETSGRELFALATRLVSVADAAAAWLLVNDRVDVGLATGVRGVHLSGRSLPPAVARSLLGTERVVGGSAHAAEALGALRTGGADYAFMGTVYPSASHPGVAGLGPESLGAALPSAAPMPVVGIGGIGPGQVADVMEAGAWGVAAIRGIWGRSDPVGAALEYLAMIDSVTHAEAGEQ